MTPDHLLELRDVCRKVLADRPKAGEILPTQEGFFFGGTEYDDWYFEGIEYTVEAITRILNDPGLTQMEMYYHASW